MYFTLIGKNIPGNSQQAFYNIKVIKTESKIFYKIIVV